MKDQTFLRVGISMIFVDTNIISYYLNSNQNVVDNFLRLFDREIKLCTTVINIYELYKGLRWKKNKKSEKELEILLEYFSVYSFTNESISIASNIYADLRRKGITVQDADILIAAVVIANNGILVTNNTKHFKNIDHLKIENWV